MLNKVLLMGYVGNVPEIKDLSNGSAIANFSLATSEQWKDKQTGEKKEKTEWHRITVFNDNIVKVVKNYVKKGSKIYIEGQIQTRKWMNEENQERYTTEVVLMNFTSKLILLNDKKNNDSENSLIEDEDNSIPFM